MEIVKDKNGEPVKVIMRKPDDFHVHLRRGHNMLWRTIGFTAQVFARALVMPNTQPNPIRDAHDVTQYKGEIGHFMGPHFPDFIPLMSIQLTEETTPAMIRSAYKSGVIAGKLYPEGVTHSVGGVKNIKKLYDVFETMSDMEITLCIHGEDPNPTVPTLEKEEIFLDTVCEVVKDFTHLKVVLEHISSAHAVEAVKGGFKNLAATITVHHLFITLEDIIGDGIQPHHYCKPIAKTNKDKVALQNAAMSGNPKFFLGTDSAPHLKSVKETAQGAPGIFTAPVAIPLLIELFERKDKLWKLENFTSKFGAEFYGIPLNRSEIAFTKKPWMVPEEYNGIVPFWKGRELKWQLIE